MSQFHNTFQNYYLDIKSLSKEKAIVFDNVFSLYTTSMTLYSQGEYKEAESYFKTLLASGF